MMSLNFNKLGAVWKSTRETKAIVSASLVKGRKKKKGNIAMPHAMPYVEHSP